MHPSIKPSTAKRADEFSSKPMVAEEKAGSGKVALGVYADYFKSGGAKGAWMLVIFFLALAACTVLQVYCSGILGKW